MRCVALCDGMTLENLRYFAKSCYCYFCEEGGGGLRRDVRYLTTLSVTEILTLSVEGDWMVVGVHKPRSPWRTHFLCWRLIFVGPQCGNCFISHFWRPEFWRGFCSSGKICERLCGWIDQLMNEWMNDASVLNNSWPCTDDSLWE
jgi:hypothetical protein